MTERTRSTERARTSDRPRQTLSPSHFAELGVGAIAYVRPTRVDGVPAFAVHGADGTPIAVAATPALAQAVARQNDLHLLAVH